MVRALLLRFGGAGRLAPRTGVRSVRRTYTASVLTCNVCIAGKRWVVGWVDSWRVCGVVARALHASVLFFELLVPRRA